MDEQQNAFIARLDERINGLEKNIDQKLDAILVQTTKTNGRLSKAEEEINHLNTIKNQMKAIYSFLGIVGTIILALLAIK